MVKRKSVSLLFCHTTYVVLKVVREYDAEKLEKNLERMNKPCPRKCRVILTHTTVLMTPKFTTLVKGYRGF